MPQTAATISCASCGAHLKFAPETDSLQCPYCNAQVAIEKSADTIVEQDYQAALEQAESTNQANELAQSITCKGCGTTVTIDSGVLSEICLFCGKPYVNASVEERTRISPHYLLPFKINGREALDKFKNWLKRLWFAPNALKKYGNRAETLKGIYLPFLTYDCSARTHYDGERGIYYYKTESYAATVNGKAVRRTRRVRHTRWYPVSGAVDDTFDDVPVWAGHSLPQERVMALEPWPLSELVAFDKAYLQGFRAEVCSISVRDGFESATQIMAHQIDKTIRSDIGGDTQRISRKQSRYAEITYKSILLPVWVSVFRFNGKLFQFIVNAQTGEVQGERPFSWLKITLSVLAGIAAATALYGLFNGYIAF